MVRNSCQADLWRCYSGKFPCRPVVRTPCFHCRSPGFNPWSGNKDPASLTMWPKKKSTEKSHDLDGSKHTFLSSLHICDIDNTVISVDFLEDVMIFFPWVSAWPMEKILNPGFFKVTDDKWLNLLKREWRATALWLQSFWGDENFLELDSGDGFTALWMY